MLKHNFLKTSWCKLRTRYIHKNASLPEGEFKSKECEITKIRNIGILAHIDAGYYCFCHVNMNKIYLIE